MASRDIKEYIGLSRNISVNKRLTEKSTSTNKVSAKPNYLYAIKDFFSGNFIAWLIHNLIVKTAAPYPAIPVRSVHDLKKAERESGPIKIAIAADWASDTIQAEGIGVLIAQSSPDYTIHLGDTYYTGAIKEMAANYYSGSDGFGIWPRGKVGSFTLLGNHEMYSGGNPYFDMIKNGKMGFGEYNAASRQYDGQEAPFFCLLNENWCILGLDTGYDSLRPGFHFHQTNTGLKFKDELINWLQNNVISKFGTKKPGIIVLTHHQYISGFNGEDVFLNPAKQLKEVFNYDPEIIWIWGHEHRFSMYGKYRESDKHISAYGRCIGNGGMPDEHTAARRVDDNSAGKYNLVLFDHRKASTIADVEVGYNGYAILEIDNENLEIKYFASYTDNSTASPISTCVIQEKWKADSAGKINFISATDNLASQPANNQLSYYGERDVNRVGH